MNRPIRSGAITEREAEPEREGDPERADRTGAELCSDGDRVEAEKEEQKRSDHLSSQAKTQRTAT